MPSTLMIMAKGIVRSEMMKKMKEGIIIIIMGDCEDGCDVKNKDNNKNYEILLMLTSAGCADNGDEGEEVNEGDKDNYDDVEEDC